MQLSAETVLLGAAPRNKLEAIELAGITLADAGLIERAYIKSMVERELHADTFLGRGIAIPHGMAPDRHLIKKTGVSVVQIPQGVEWNNGERVDLVVAIAAKSDEHLHILSALTDVLDDEELIERLSKTQNVEDIVAALGGTPQPKENPSEAFEGQSVEAKVNGYAGLHARPAARLAEIASQFESKIRIEFGTRSASTESTMSLLKLGVAGGETVRVVAQGVDAKQALEVLKREIESGLGDDLYPAPSSVSFGTSFTPVSDAPFFQGVKAAPGLAIAPLHVWRQGEIQVPEKGADIATEQNKLEIALQRSREELDRLRRGMGKRGGGDEAAIFEAQLALQEDRELREEAESLIRAGYSAAWSWHRAVDARKSELLTSSNARLAERSADLQDVDVRVLGFLGIQSAEYGLPEHPVVLVAQDLAPSQVVELDTQRVVGICTVEGGPTSHTAILAAALKIPLVVGAGAEILQRSPSDEALCVLDGNAGRLYSNPSESDLKAAWEVQEQLQKENDVAASERYRPALLRDGHRIEIVANIGVAREAGQAIENGAEGVGLLRTEFLFLHRETAPSEDEQFEALCEMTQALNGLPLVVRTLDIGGDKVLPYLPQPHEENPFLGVRGVRLTLRQPELFRTQLRAIFRASETGVIRVLFPMVGTLEEWRRARDFAESVREEVGALPVEYGVMIEVPSAALMAREFAEEVDFFSIGTNDLTQYTLAIDRLHPELGAEADSLHPAVLRLVARTVEAAHAKKKRVSVCGNMSDEPLAALVLAGLGVNALSLSIPAIPRIKAAFRQTNLDSIKTLSQRALACRTASEVRELGGEL